MPRSVVQDVLTNYPFWLMDVAPIELLALPVLTPSFGFSAITAPELTLETEEIQEGNWFFPRKVVRGASVGTITLSRGATFTDSDFYRWIRATLTGNTENFQSEGYNTATMLAAGTQQGGAVGALSFGVGAMAGLFGVPRIGGPSPRRDLTLIQFFGHEPTEDLVAAGLAQSVSIALSADGLLSMNPFAIGISGRTQRVPARAWKLKGCIPTRYKVGSDFDAAGIEVSIMELDVECESFTELSLAAI